MNKHNNKFNTCNSVGTFSKKGKIRQHFVPQFYLRNFGKCLYSFDKKTEEKIRSQPKNLAVKSDFYGGEFHDFPSPEKKLSKIESELSVSIKNLIEKKDYYSLNNIDKKQVCEFLSLQHLRTQNRLEVNKTIAGLRLNLNETKIPLKSEQRYDKYDYSGMLLAGMKHYKKYAQIFYLMRFSIMENKTKIPLWTSDNPIAKQNEANQAHGMVGIVCSGIEVHVPLTPKLSLVVLDPEHFSEYPNKIKMTESDVNKENFLQIESSKRFVYSQSSAFHQINDMLKDHPQCKDENRCRSITIPRRRNGITIEPMIMELNLRCSIDHSRLISTNIKQWLTCDKMYILLS